MHKIKQIQEPWVYSYQIINVAGRIIEGKGLTIMKPFYRRRHILVTQYLTNEKEIL